MPEKILGIDLGSDSVKVVQVSRSFRAAEITGYASARLPADAEPSQVARTLKDLLSEHGLESDHYLLSVGTQEAFVRRISFPFAAERKIAQVIGFDLEPSLPLGLDEVLVDFVKREKLGDGSQGVLAAAFPRRILDPLLTAFREVGINPKVVDLDGSALSAIANELQDRVPEQVLMLDIGQRKTNFLYRRLDQTSYVRALMFGCDRFAKAISGALDLSPQEGLERLFSVGLDGSPATPDVEGVRTALTREVELLAREVQVSLLAAQVQGQEQMPELIVLAGGGSLITGLGPAIQRALGLPVRNLAELADDTFLGQFKNPSRELPVFAVATGLALGRLRRRRGFNFQPEEARSRDIWTKWRGHLRYAAVAGILIVLSWLTSVGADIYVKKQRLTELNRGIETVFHRALPDVKGSLKPTQYASILKAKINDLSQSVAFFAEAEQHSAVELLRSISQAIPENLDVTINLLTMDGDHVRISGRADAFNTVDALKNRLVELHNFTRVSITDAKAATDGKGVQFSLELLRSRMPGESK